jgi:DNA-binding transcriptional ArsR family regulator
VSDLLTAFSAADVSRIITKNLDFLSSKALLIFRALHTVAVEACEARGYSPQTSQVVIFCPAEMVARGVGISSATLYRALPELVEAGLVDARGHFCTLRGRTRSDGTLWAVRLRPGGGCKARLSYGDLKAKYRDLGGDIEAGRTSWAILRESKDNPSREVNLDLIRRWALPPSPTKPPIASAVDSRMASRRSLEALLDVPHAERGERSRVVSLAAEALAAALRDRGGTGFYRKLLWQLLRRLDATGEDHSYSVYLAAQRAAVDASEGFARKAGALFVSRLKRAGWWSEVMNAPPTRVGVRPLEA